MRRILIHFAFSCMKKNAWLLYPTERFTVIEPENLSIGEIWCSSETSMHKFLDSKITNCLVGC